MSDTSFLVSVTLRTNHSQWIAAPSAQHAIERARALWLSDRTGFNFNYADQFDIAVVDEEPAATPPERNLS